MLGTIRLVDLAVILQATLTGLTLSPVASASGDTGQPLVSVNICWVAELRVSPHQLSKSKLLVRALMWSVKKGTPKSSWICLLTTYKGVPVAMWRHLDSRNCSFQTWQWVADLQMRRVIHHGMDDLLVEQDSIPDGETTPPVWERTQHSQSPGSFLSHVIDMRRSR